jgi:hypothetical protein
MKKLPQLLILLFLLNCKSEKKPDLHNYGGQMIRIDFDASKTSPNNEGYGAEIYPSGKIKSLSYYKNGKPVDTLYLYYENGIIKEKGLIKNGLRNGWWTYYRENGSMSEKIDWINIGSDTIYKNQNIVFDLNGQIQMESSSFFELALPDSLILGKNIGFIKNYVSGIKNADKRYLSVIIKNTYEDALVKSDTFSDGSLHPYFGINGFQTGKQLVQGKIEEKILKTDRINEDSTSLIIMDNYKYFEKEFIVTDKEKISTLSEKIIQDYFDSKKNN